MTKTIVSLLLPLLTGCTLFEKRESDMLPVLEIGIVGRQSSWTAHYPGPDGIRGKTSYKLVTPSNPVGLDTADTNASDDFLTTRILHLPKDQEVSFYFHSLDVIHAGYFPHFRIQMNAVPGMTSPLSYTPKKTTAEMRAELQDPNFNFLLLCNKVCGAGHYKMQMTVVVETKDAFNRWYREKTNEVRDSLVRPQRAVK